MCLLWGGILRIWLRLSTLHSKKICKGISDFKSACTNMKAQYQSGHAPKEIQYVEVKTDLAI